MESTPRFHMLSCFRLNPGEDIQGFRQAYVEFVEAMKAIDLIASSGPIGRRQNDTPMDTDEVRDHEFFAVMSFRDRAQADAAYDHIMRHSGPEDEAHEAVFPRVLDPVFICWQDLP